MKNKTLETIKQILSEHDPVKLIKIGAPIDEYDYEAVSIFERCFPRHSLDEVREIIYDVFLDAFSDPDNWRDAGTIKLIGNIENYAEIAQKIKEAIDAP